MAPFYGQDAGRPDHRNEAISSFDRKPSCRRESEGIPGIAGVVAGMSHRRCQRDKSVLAVQRIGRLHPRHGFQINGGISRPGSTFQNDFHQSVGPSLSPQERQEIHLPELANPGHIAIQGAESSAAHRALRPCDHPICSTRLPISRREVIHLRVKNGISGSGTTEFRHHRPDHGGHGGIVLRTNRSKGVGHRLYGYSPGATSSPAVTGCFSSFGGDGSPVDSGSWW